MKVLDENTEGRDFLVGDIHGCYELLMDEMKAVGFDKKVDRLISVGDLVDRGPESYKCLSLPFEPWFYGVRGNHELLMEDAVTGGNVQLWLMNGGQWIADENVRDVAKVVEAAMERLPVALQVPFKGKRIGVIHADVTSGQWGLFNEFSDVWSRTRITSQRELPEIRGIDLVIVGHTILDEPERRANVLHIDTGAFHTGRLTMIEAKDLFS